MDWAQILVIILAVALAVFLVVAITLTVILIRITQQIKTVTSSAERTVEGVEKAVTNFTNVTSPVYLAKLLGKQVKKFKSK